MRKKIINFNQKILMGPGPTNIDDNLAIFSSKEGRNQDLLIKIWKEHIYPKNDKFKLFKAKREVTNQVVLSKSEVLKLYHFDFTKNTKLEISFLFFILCP